MTENEKLLQETRGWLEEQGESHAPVPLVVKQMVRRLADALEAAETLKSKERGTCARRT